MEIEAGPVRVDLSYYQGDDKFWEVELTDENNAPINLTGKTISGGLKTSYSASTSIAFTIQNVDLANGKFNFGITKAVGKGLATTSKLNAAYVYDLQIIYSSTRNETQFYGTFRVLPEAN